MVSRVREVLRWTSGPDVLDVGCSGQDGRRSDFTSEWWLHGQLLAKFPDAWGLDYSHSNVAALAAHGVANIYQGDAQDFHLERSFDTIVAGELIEHLEDPGAFLRCAVKHLKPSGRIILTTPYPFSVGFVLYSWIRFPKTCSNPEHTMWLCPTTMRQLAERVGLQVDTWYLVDHYRPDLPSRTGRAVGRIMRTIGPLLPSRVRSNSMFFVLSPNLTVAAS
jgi:2-polyprenyl-3-methyl-5-hydroxy-6-metoxy-1,4-benzoquinol methylase